jgi:hypothetical protein
MASDPGHFTQPPLAAARPPAPLAGTRAQAIQRLQVGLFGLGAMILLVGLANIIMTNARRHDAEVVAQAAPAAPGATAPASDPLADAGVVPDMPAARPRANTTTDARAQGGR